MFQMIKRTETYPLQVANLLPSICHCLKMPHKKLLYRQYQLQYNTACCQHQRATRASDSRMHVPTRMY